MDYGYFYHLFHFKILYTKQNKYLTKKPVGIHSSGRLIQIINLAFNIVCTSTWQWLLNRKPIENSKGLYKFCHT